MTGFVHHQTMLLVIILQDINHVTNARMLYFFQAEGVHA